MPDTPWQVTNHQASLRYGRFSALVDALGPASGLRQVRFSELELPGAELLKVGLPSVPEQLAAEHVELYARGADLVATYRETPQRPFRTQVYYRAMPETPGVIGGLELVVSVQTHLLESDPGLGVRSYVPWSTVSWLLDPVTAEFEPLPIEREPWDILRAGGPGCLLFAGPPEFCYAEMAHPADEPHSSFSIEGRTIDDTNNLVELRHRLFSRSLEKGVILKARILSLFLVPDGARPTLAKCYADFAASDPPLTT